MIVNDLDVTAIPPDHWKQIRHLSLILML